MADTKNVVSMNPNKRDARSVLEEALEWEPDTVVVCMLKGHEISTRTSASDCAHEVVGCWKLQRRTTWIHGMPNDYSDRTLDRTATKTAWGITTWPIQARVEYIGCAR